MSTHQLRCPKELGITCRAYLSVRFGFLTAVALTALLVPGTTFGATVIAFNEPGLSPESAAQDPSTPKGTVITDQFQT